MGRRPQAAQLRPLRRRSRPRRPERARGGPGLRRLEAAGGRSEFAVKTKGEVERVREFGDVVVAFRDGAPTRLADVARVEDGVEDERTFAELDGVQGVSLRAAPTVRPQHRRGRPRGPRRGRCAPQRASDGTRITVARDTARFIESSVHDVGIEIVLGACSPSSSPSPSCAARGRRSSSRSRSPPRSSRRSSAST
ncbi:MAG: efflux RND transporter permease subunit [Myxococcota bacterium]